MEKPKVLILDDEPTIHDSIKYALRKHDVEFVSATKVSDAISLFKESPGDFVVGFVDHRLKQKDQSIELGVGAIPFLREVRPDFTPVMISGCEDESVLKSWLDQKVNRYLYKPLKPDHLKAIFEVELEKWKQSHIEKRQEESVSIQQLSKFGMVGRSEVLVNAVNLALKAAKSDSQLVTLILGESGTGKELIAKGIHNHSSRSEKSFLPVNCAAFGSNTTLVDSQLFGHEKGSFTGADKRKVGIFEAANGGTVFLDEVHCLSKSSQEKLLRVLQEKKIRRVGGNEEYPVNFRLIAASKPDIQDRAQSNEFLSDLFYRLNGFDIKLPPLRERGDDITILSQFFLEKMSEGKQAKSFSPEVKLIFKNFDWPGNVRELESAIERAFEVCDGEVITVGDLPKNVAREENINQLLGIIPLDALREDYERKVIKSIVSALEKTGDNVSSASKLLNAHRADIRYKMKALGINQLTKEDRIKIAQA